MADRRPVHRPWGLAAWALLVAAFACGVFDLYAPAAVLFVASLACAAAAFRGAKPSRGGRGPELPRQ